MTQSPRGEELLNDGSERPHKGLLAWQKAIDLTVKIYRLTEKFPADERFGLTSQMRRAAVSVPSNIAEGSARSTDKDKVHFYMISRGSLSELDTQAEIVARLGFINEESRTQIQSAISEASAFLQGLIRSKQSGPQ